MNSIKPAIEYKKILKNELNELFNKKKYNLKKRKNERHHLITLIQDELINVNIQTLIKIYLSIEMYKFYKEKRGNIETEKNIFYRNLREKINNI